MVDGIIQTRKPRQGGKLNIRLGVISHSYEPSIQTEAGGQPGL